MNAVSSEMCRTGVLLFTFCVLDEDALCVLDEDAPEERNLIVIGICSL